MNITKFAVISVASAALAICGCGDAHTEESISVPTLREYESRLDDYFHRQELKGGVGGDVAQIKRKMSDAFKAATDDDKRKLYDRVK